MAEMVAATPREGKFNKNAARRVRVLGRIPAVVYGAKEASIALEVDPKQIQRILHSDTGHNTIFDLEISGSTAKAKAMIVDWQYEPIKGHLLASAPTRAASAASRSRSTPRGSCSSRAVRSRGWPSRSRSGRGRRAASGRAA